MQLHQLSVTFDSSTAKTNGTYEIRPAECVKLLLLINMIEKKDLGVLVLVFFLLTFI